MAKKKSLDWSEEVKTKKSPPAGLFADGSSTKIADWLASAHKTKASATSALNFYINRAGDNLSASDKSRLERAKTLLDRKFPETEKK